MQKLKKLFSSDVLEDCRNSQKIAYIAVMTALSVICNMFFEFKFADTQFSLTLFFSAITGIIIGPTYGFVACFTGDLVGFLCNSGGFMYMPWIGISMGLTAFIAGLVMNVFPSQKKVVIAIKLGVICLLTFIICNVMVNTTAFWIVYNTKKVPYIAYLSTRLFVSGQIYNSLVNYCLLFVGYPTFIKIKEVIKRKK